MKRVVIVIFIGILLTSLNFGEMIIDYAMTISDGVTEWPDDGVIIGHTGTGSVTHTGGEVTVDELLIGYSQNSLGTYELSGSGVLYTKAIVIGSGGLAFFNQTGGVHHCSSMNFICGSSGLNDGADGSGVYTLFDGTLRMQRMLLSYSAGNSGSFLMTGGVLDIGTYFVLPPFINSVNFGEGEGTFMMTGGDATFRNLTVSDRVIFDLYNGGTISADNLRLITV